VREKGVCFVVVERVEEVVFPREGTEEKINCAFVLSFFV